MRSSWRPADPPLVSIIIPNRNGADLLRTCLDGILDGTDYPNREVVIVENSSDDPATFALYDEAQRRGPVRIVRWAAPFNYSAACNHGAATASGSLLLFLNNDIEITDRHWLDELVRLATRPGVGVVGTKLRYPDGVLQHAGVVVGIHLFGLVFHRTREGEWGVFGSTEYVRNWSAIMGACQMVTRAAFQATGGFDEGYRVANSDVALCLRARAAGFRTVYTPFAALTHHEGATRGHSNPAADMARSARDVAALGIAEDPYLHPGLGGDPALRLRHPGEPSLHETLAAECERALRAV